VLENLEPSGTQDWRLIVAIFVVAQIIAGGGCVVIATAAFTGHTTWAIAWAPFSAIFAAYASLSIVLTIVAHRAGAASPTAIRAGRASVIAEMRSMGYRFQATPDKIMNVFPPSNGTPDAT
jgi:hypothetical protein